METAYTVLIVDDEEDLRDMMAFQFKARGFDVITAGDGIEGLERLKSVTPSLIILDLNMPRMGGIEMYQRICGPDGKPMYPVLILTARANTEQMFKDLDIDGFIAKPFEVDDLIHEAELIIRKHARMAPEKKKGLGVLKTIYIADDSKAESNAIALALVNAGYRVAVASSGTVQLKHRLHFRLGTSFTLFSYE